MIRFNLKSETLKVDTILDDSELRWMFKFITKMQNLEPAFKYAIIQQYNSMATDWGMNKSDPNEFKNIINDIELYCEMWDSAIRENSYQCFITTDCISGLGDHDFMIYVDNLGNISKIDLRG